MTRRDAYSMVAIVAALCAITILWGERIGINGGQGWDGMDYAEWARDFPRAFHHGWNAYQAQRVLPSAIVYLLGGREHAVDKFQLFDAAMLVAAAIAWTRVVRVMAWSRSASWASFVAVFGSFAIARHALYYPALTDSLAFTLGVVMVWAYLADRPIVLWLVAALGALTWPSLPLVALVLLVLRKNTVEPIAARWIRPVAGIVALGVACTVCGVSLYYLGHPQVCRASMDWTVNIPRGLLWISIPCLAAWVGLAIYALASGSRSWNVVALVKSQGPRTIVTVVGSVAVIAGQAWWLSQVGTGGPGASRAQLTCELTLEPLRGPLWNLVHHVVYFGPIVIVAAGAWRRLARVADDWGLGAVIALGIATLLAVGSESRHLLHLFPFLVATTIAATAAWWTPTRAVVFAATCVAWSKLWWLMHYDIDINAYTWPNQRYFMQQGPWASDETFVIHAAAVVVTAAVLFVLHRRRVA